MSWPWSELGLDGPVPLREIRQAYAERLKTTHPEEDPDGFQRLHEAYQAARRASTQLTHTPPAPTESETPSEATYVDPPEEPTPSPSPSQTGHLKWEFDDLLETSEQAVPHEQESSLPDWDYERLFQEEADARASARYQQYQGKGTAEDIEAIDHALQIIENFFAVRAPLPRWIHFLHSGDFFRVKGHPIFLSELCTFFEKNPTIDPSIRRAFQKAYGLDHQYIPKPYRSLYCVLLHQSQTTFMQKIYALRKIILVISLCFLFAAGLKIIPAVRLEREYNLLASDIEADFGRAVHAPDKGKKVEKKLFAPMDEPDLYFLAWRTGERDMAHGKHGYETNFGDALTYKSLKRFAKKWDLRLTAITEDHKSAEMAASHGIMPAQYDLELPFTGAGDCITALGDLLHEMQEEPWYALSPPSFQLHLSCKGIAYYHCSIPNDPFDATQLRKDYETAMPWQVGAYIIQQSGLGETDFGSKDYHLQNAGTIELGRKHYYVIRGVKPNAAKASYVYLFTGTQLYSIRADIFESILRKNDSFFVLSGNVFKSQSDTLSHAFLLYQVKN